MALLPVPQYSGVSNFSNRKPSISKILTDLKLKQFHVKFFFQIETFEFYMQNVKSWCLGH